MFYVNKYIVGSIKTNCYVIVDENTGKAAIVDPGESSRELNDEIDIIGRDNIEYILLTHGHFDHIMKADEYRKLTNAKIVVHKDESDFTSNSVLNLSYLIKDGGIEPFEADKLMIEDEQINLGDTTIGMMHTPGHTRGGACYFVEDCIFSGDTLMKESMGRTDLITGDYNQIKGSLKRLADIKENYKVYPGHGDETTLEYERENNPYLGKASYDDLY